MLFGLRKMVSCSNFMRRTLYLWGVHLNSAILGHLAGRLRVTLLTNPVCFLLSLSVKKMSLVLGVQGDAENCLTDSMISLENHSTAAFPRLRKFLETQPSNEIISEAVSTMSPLQDVTCDLMDQVIEPYPWFSIAPPKCSSMKPAMSISRYLSTLYQNSE